MFIIDGAENYTYLKFVQVCYSKNILFFCLLSHISHISYFFQSLDVVYFQSFKYYHVEAIDATI